MKKWQATLIITGHDDWASELLAQAIEKRFDLRKGYLSADLIDLKQIED